MSNVKKRISFAPSLQQRLARPSNGEDRTRQESIDIEDLQPEQATLIEGTVSGSLPACREWKFSTPQASTQSRPSSRKRPASSQLESQPHPSTRCKI